ncbi:unnamed protein product [Caenorhabditis auriculariae]|uniref:Uncharacterized protein n=1 Tax=Caenorhabditis auriculariae TaxID=2777116 RepID=A0A8S1HVC8_9PELO|nr:unnamed protein product [Caenorhabditis auriculariae]
MCGLEGLYQYSSPLTTINEASLGGYRSRGPTSGECGQMPTDASRNTKQPPFAQYRRRCAVAEHTTNKDGPGVVAGQRVNGLE